MNFGQNSKDGDLFGQHLKQMMFMNKLQENEHAFRSFVKHNGEILPKGGGLGAGGGLQVNNNALPSGGFGKHHPEIQAQMIGGGYERGYEVKFEDGIPDITPTGTMVGGGLQGDRQQTEFEQNKKGVPEAPVTKISIQGEIKQLTGLDTPPEGAQPIPSDITAPQREALELARRRLDPEEAKRLFTGNSTRHVVLISEDGNTYDLGSQAKAAKTLALTKHAIQMGKPPKHHFDIRNLKDHGVVAFVDKDTKKLFENLKKYEKIVE